MPTEVIPITTAQQNPSERATLEATEVQLTRASSTRSKKQPSPRGTKLVGHKGEYRIVRPLGGVCGSYECEGSLFAKAYDTCSPALRLFCYPRERGALEALRGLGVTPDLLDHGKGQSLIVQPYIAGQDLTTRINGQPLDPRETRNTLLTITQKLKPAHEAGWIHRDLKPSNIYLTKTEGPMVMDWGLSYNPDVHTNEPEARIGTPAYLSPEQLLAQPCDERTDTYLLGMVLLESLVGYNPRRNERKTKTFGVPRLPYNPRDYKADADQKLSWITLKATQPDPERRYQTLDELASDLREAA